MNKQGEHKINWTDYSWNPVTGCRHTCPYCYARRNFERYGRSFEPALHVQRLREPYRVQGTAPIDDPANAIKIFVCSVADLFGQWVPSEWIDRVLAVVRENPDKIFQFLTKNPSRLPNFNPWPANAWVGASGTDRAMILRAHAHLVHVEAPVRYLSSEPLLGDPGDLDLAGLQWVIIGALTGPGARQPAADWKCNLEYAADMHGIAVMYKENLQGDLRRIEWPIRRNEYAQEEQTRSHPAHGTGGQPCLFPG